MINPYTYDIDNLTVVVYASNKAEATKRFNEAMRKHDLKVNTDAIDECIDILNCSFPLVENEDIVFGFKCAVERLEKLKESKNMATNKDKLIEIVTNDFGEVVTRNFTKLLTGCSLIDCQTGIKCEDCKYKGFWEQECKDEKCE